MSDPCNAPCPASAELRALLRHVVGDAATPVPLHAPEIQETEQQFVMDCLRSTFVSSVGRYVNEFEDRLAAFTGARCAVAVSNGTSALHLALHLAGVRAGDEVIVPALSFVATSNAVSHCGAIPHFVDSQFDTMGMDPWVLQDYLQACAEPTTGGVRNRSTGRRIAAIVPMHTFGHPVAMGPLMELAARLGLPIVEDAAESLGSTIGNVHTGTIGRLGVLSFNGNKLVTTGGGGAILTNDPELGKLARHLSTTAKQPHAWEFVHDQVAWNYRMPNLNAALGCAQMEHLGDMLRRKRELAASYRQAAQGAAAFAFMAEPAGTRSNYWLNTIRLTPAYAGLRDRVLGDINVQGYQCRPVWRLLADLPMYRDCPRAPLPVGRALEGSLINLPSSPGLAAARPA